MNDKCPFCKLILALGVENLEQTDELLYTLHLELNHGLTQITA